MKLNNLNTNIENEIDALNNRISILNISLHPSNDMKKVVDDKFRNMCKKNRKKNQQ